MFTDQERLQRKREMARLRQARKRARDRERQSLSRDSLGSGMDLDSGDIGAVGVRGGGRSDSGEHSLNQDGGTDDELNDDEEPVFKVLEIAGSERHVRQNGSSSAGGGGGGGTGGGTGGTDTEAVLRSRGEPRGKGVVEVALQLPPVVVPGIAPMQLHPVHHHEMQGIAASSGTETPATQTAVGSMDPHDRMPVVVYSDQPRRISGNVVVAMEEEDGDEESGDNHALFWPWLRRTVRLIESSRNNRKLQEDIYTVLYTEEMAQMLEREAHRLTNQQPELLKEKVSSTPELGGKNIAPLGLSEEGDKESGDEMVDELLGHLERRIQAIKKQKGLKAEVQNLKRDLLNKEAQLKEYDAIVDSERAAWRAERAQLSVRK
ncbi:uncharacterized protein H6S33_001588 [Morchella sextelata]|uniref:uncharacterized protein n=1 Tax=Morchella sextelata TaxID=1174677 RepID=UPI001D04CE15|nr:uncharacterized protein H6S33_001588 [Morchella sextelata]KAH0608454.1 hypothetical protein H6S33_001588 [Morchella sextelata]